MSNSRNNNFLQPYSIGLKLRTLRNEKRLTLARLAAATGYSTALLSKLETDRMIPTLQTLEIVNECIDWLSRFTAQVAPPVEGNAA